MLTSIARRTVLRVAVAGAATALTATSIVACSPGSPGSAAKSVTLRWAYVLAPDSPFDKGAQQVKRLVEERTDGRVKIEIFLGGQLGSDAETAEATMEGSIDINSGGLPYAAMPALQVQVSPFVFRDADHLRRVMNGDVARKRLWDPVREATGVEFLDSWYFGTMYFFSKKPFTDAASAGGVKIRVPEQQMAVESVKALGATPTPIAFPELYTALQIGTVDAMFGPLPNNYGAKLNEVVDYVIEYGYPSNVSTVINENSLARLSDEDQKILRGVFQEVGPQVTEETKKQESEFLARANKDLKVLDADVDSFRRAVQDNFLPQYGKIFGDGLYEALFNDQVKP